MRVSDPKIQEATEWIGIFLLSSFSGIVSAFVFYEVAFLISPFFLKLEFPALTDQSVTSAAFRRSLAVGWFAFSWGIILATCSRVGANARFRAIFFLKPIAGWMLLTLLTAVIGGIVGYMAGKTEALELYHAVAKQVPPEMHPVYIAVQFSSMAGAFAGGLGAVFLCGWTWKKRSEVDELLYHEGPF